MKKWMSFILLVLFVVLFIPENINADTSSTNLINPDKVHLEISANNDGESEINITSREKIAVAANVEYFIIPTYINRVNSADFDWNLAPMFQDEATNEICTYNEDDEVNEYYILHKKLLVTPGRIVGYSVTFNDEVSSISFDNISLTTSDYSPTELTSIYHDAFEDRVDYFLLMIAANDISKLPIDTSYVYEYSSTDYDVSNLYLGEDASVFGYGNVYSDEKVPIIETNLYEYTTFVDNPITIDGLIEKVELTAIDEIDGDLTSQITYEATEYETLVLNESDIRNRRLGEYSITYSVMDNSNNCATCIITLIVIDNTKPVVNYNTSTLAYQISIADEKLDLEFLLSNIDVSDNYSKVLSEVITNNYHEDPKDIGLFSIGIKYFDESNNTIEVLVRITVVDDIAPEIRINDNNYQISYHNPKIIEDILTELEVVVSDNYDPSLSYYLIVDEYTGSESVIGTYLVQISSVDSSNNFSSTDLIIEVIDDVNPIFYLNETKVTVTANELLDLNKVKTILKERHLVKQDEYHLEVIYDNYSENSTKPGDYDVRLKITYEDGETQYEKFTISVTDSEKVNQGFFGKVWGVILTILLFIWNIIKWPFEKLFGLFR